MKEPDANRGWPTKHERAWLLWSLLGLGITALLSVGAHLWPTRAATNRFVAVGGSDTSNDCSNAVAPCATIQHAINQSASGDLIKLGPGTYFENVTVSQNVTIQGDATTGSTVNGNNTGTVFTVGAGVSATLNELVIVNGLGKGGVPGTSSWDSGGGIANDGILTVSGCTISGNRALTGAAGGGGIFSRGNSATNTLTVTNTTITDNFAGIGGGIDNDSGIATVVNTTIDGNIASIGGGIRNSEFGTLNLTGSTISHSVAANDAGISNDFGATLVSINVTVSGNFAATDVGGITNVGTATLVNNTIVGNTQSSIGGGDNIHNFATLSMINTIVASSNKFATCLNGGTITPNSHNLVQDGSCGSAFSGDPKLGPLQNNGGPTATHALLASSPAIDAGDDSVLGAPLFLTTDQRGPGFPRKFGAHVDIGAFEFQGFDTCLKDNNTGNLFQFNSANGQYKFTRCSDGFMISGTGVVSTVNGILMLTDSKPDRRVSAGFNTGQRTGSVTIYIMIAQGVWQTFRISSTNPNAVCSCQG